jgi:uncharacterized protein
MKCDLCETKEVFGYKCHHCGKIFCTEHRLPENHQCSDDLGYIKPQTTEIKTAENK